MARSTIALIISVCISLYLAIMLYVKENDSARQPAKSGKNGTVSNGNAVQESLKELRMDVARIANSLHDMKLAMNSGSQGITSSETTTNSNNNQNDPGEKTLADQNTVRKLVSKIKSILNVKETFNSNEEFIKSIADTIRGSLKLSEADLAQIERVLLSYKKTKDSLYKDYKDKLKKVNEESEQAHKRRAQEIKNKTAEIDSKIEEIKEKYKSHPRSIAQDEEFKSLSMQKAKIIAETPWFSNLEDQGKEIAKAEEHYNTSVTELYKSTRSSLKSILSSYTRHTDTLINNLIGSEPPTTENIR